MELTLSFLSPITPTSTLRQSIPASYLTVYAEGTFDVSVYMDMNGQWVSGDRGALIQWSFDEINVDGEDPVLKKWEVRRETEMLLTEFHDRSEWGALHFTGPAVSLAKGPLLFIYRRPSAQRVFRTSVTNLGHPHCFDNVSQGQAPCKM